jgi:hypothetical protein
MLPDRSWRISYSSNEKNPISNEVGFGENSQWMYPLIKLMIYGELSFEQLINIATFCAEYILP